MDDEWCELDIIKTFLKKFKEITVIMSSSSYPTLSMVIPLYNALIDHTEDYISDDNNSSVIKNAATNCRTKLLEYYNKTNDACIIVTILDPRLKMEYYDDKTWEDEHRKEINEKYLF